MAPNPINALTITIYNTTHTNNPKIHFNKYNIFENAKNTFSKVVSSKWWAFRLICMAFVYFIFFVYFVCIDASVSMLICMAFVSAFGWIIFYIFCIQLTCVYNLCIDRIWIYLSAPCGASAAAPCFCYAAFVAAASGCDASASLFEWPWVCCFGLLAKLKQDSLRIKQ